MIADHLAAACNSLDSCQRELQRAYTEAVDKENEFAIIVLLDLAKRVAKLQKRLDSAKAATWNEAP